MKKNKPVLLLGAVTGVLIITLFLMHYGMPVAENTFYDLTLSFVKAQPPDSIVIVGLDSKSISEYGTTPWPRAITARLIDKIQSYSPKTIAMDFLFPKRPEDPNSDSLALVFGKIPNLVIGLRVDNVSEEPDASIAMVASEAYKHRFLLLKNQEKLSETIRYTAEKLDFGDPYLSQYATRAGFLNVSTSKTSQKLREIIHIMRVGKEYYPSFGLAAAAAFLALKPDQFALDGDGFIWLNEKKIALSRGAGAVYLNYRGKSGTIPTLSAADVIKGNIPGDMLKNKLVFVGITDALSSPTDFFLTPAGVQFPGVEIWATAAADLLNDTWIKRGGIVSFLNWLVILCIFPGAILLFSGRRKKYGLACGSGLLVLSILAGILILQSTGCYWNTGFHLYAWAFMIVWYATQKQEVIIIKDSPLLLEPVVTEDKIAPPNESDFIQSIPQTETASFVFCKIAPNAINSLPSDQQIEKTIVESDIAKPDAMNQGPVDSAVIASFQKLANGRIIRHLGTGGMADVYLIWHPRMEVYRAVKVIKPGQPKQWIERFETEIRIFANLNHPNIVQCYGVGEWYTLPYLEMEYVPGVTIEHLLKTGIALSPVDVAAIGILVCRALRYSHNEVVNVYGESYKGIVHRDLKPANILLSRSGHIKLTDFGIARPGAVSLHTKESGKVIGTLPYLAPEQFKGDIITAKTDQYALGATLFEMATRKRAFPQRDIPTLIAAKSEKNFKPLEFAPELPKPLAEIIEQATALEPANRFSSVLEMGQKLELFLNNLLQKKDLFILSDLRKRVFTSA